MLFFERRLTNVFQGFPDRHDRFHMIETVTYLQCFDLFLIEVNPVKSPRGAGVFSLDSRDVAVTFHGSAWPLHGW